ncbi:MAG: RDD family protein [Propionibacterium sp.]|nr:RDD family protein [Propionibacterium sp.]
MSSPTGQLPPMGWYPDPAGSGDERYWDGSGWTANVRPAQPAPTTPASRQAAPWTAPAPVPGPWSPWPGTPGPDGQSHPSQAPERRAASWQPVAAGQAAPAERVVVAGWGRRALAYAIDWIIVYMLVQLLLAPVSSRMVAAADGAMSQISANPQMSSSGLLLVLQNSGLLQWYLVILGAQAAVQAVYFALQFRYLAGSLGQRALDMRVIPAGRAGAPLTWRMCIVRAVVKSVLFTLPVVWLVAILWPAFTRTRQGLHDLAARTQVIRR